MLVTKTKQKSVTTIWKHILQNIIFCVQQKKETYTGLKQLGGE